MGRYFIVLSERVPLKTGGDALSNNLTCKSNQQGTQDYVRHLNIRDMETNNLCFRPGLTQTDIYTQRRSLDIYTQRRSLEA